ncbi:uncharacterized protein F4807DRAFT_427629 [Annulohypoxylon truncatum]|uniref:uncharacterized protein n=1 Tax=Annulohypoxylon truncatum TaxID=327061 RepID=UPI002008DB94|nr:uncharacterized protein F4807DRAFT_427629 [Annulohypoxylon truncatum]KAI1209218.1 hypothetical protein F4807DRAFT_427629 [Annulohypoxylon truncatum]
MTKNLKSTTELGSLQSTVPGILEEKRLQRRLFRIPADQRKLLEHPQSWAAFQSNCTKPFLNVPCHVIEGLKECHARQLEEAQPEGVEESKDLSELSESSNSPLHPPSDDTDQDGKEDSPAPSLQSQPFDDDWPPSPEKNKYPPQRVDNKETPLRFVTQPPPVSSPRLTEPTGLAGPASVKREPVVFPSSNPEEEPLDVEVPISVHNSIPPVNKSAVSTFATPPSAQIVPCTLPLSDQSSKQQEVVQKQRVYKPVPPLYRRPEKQPTSAHLNHNAAQLGHIDSPTTDIQSSLSTTNTSSSIIPSTMPGEALSRGMPGWTVDPVTSPSKESHISHEEHNVQNSPEAQCHSPEYKPQSPVLGYSPSALPTSQTRLEVEPCLDSDSQPPFVRYTVTYPNYNGTIRDFVTACMYIQLQQRRIRTSLYDDFIRAWHEGYVPYVRDCDDADPPVKALNALEWYNGIDDDPLFTSRVITKQNLQSTLDHYPDELRSAHNLLGLTPSQAQEVTSTPDAALLVDGHKPVSKDEDDTLMDEESSSAIPAASKPAVDKNDFAYSKPTASMQPPAVSRKVMPLHKSFGEIEKRPTGTKVLARSFSDVTRQKRKASEELNSNGPKRLSVNSLPRSEAESSTSFDPDISRRERQSSIAPSIAPSSTAGSRKSKKKYMDEARIAMSINRWKKKREKEEIASSAPVSNTPTSAQRE